MEDNNLIPDLVPLELIDPNPWQVRMEEDQVHVMDLAGDIARGGLLQPGMGRRVGERVQLAFGHRRLEAFKFLNETFGPDGNGQAGTEYAQFPVNIRTLDDQTMAEFAIAENFERRDLTAIEKGRALRRYMTDFGKTQAEAGERFSLTQSAVSHLISLVENLPEELQNLVAQRRLAERHARVLVPVARLSVENAVRIGKLVAEADPAENDRVASDALADFCESEGQLMNAAHWPPDWKSEVVLDGERAPVCGVCPAFFRGKFDDDYCLRPECMKAKLRAWEDHELTRLSEKLGIAIGAPDDASFQVLKLDYQHETAARNLLKRKTKPDCLRLVAKRVQIGVYEHQRLLDSEDVLLASSDPHVLDPKKEAPTSAPSPGATDEDVEVAAARARQAEKEREEHEVEARRSEREAIRRAQADMTWLVFNTAEMLAPQMTIQPRGLLLETLENHHKCTHGPSYEWSEYQMRYQALEDVSVEAESSPLVGYQAMIARELGSRMSGYNAKEQFNWMQALEDVKELARDWGLKLFKGWNEPPIHKTPANCHVCGRFTSMDHITARDGEEGWRVDGEVVTCSEECRGKLVEHEAARKVAKGKVAGRKSPAGKKSAGKGKKRCH